MKEVLLYGPPASGKLTVAKELARQTGYRLLHNHLSVDLAASLHDAWSPSFWHLLDSIRTLMLRNALETDTNIITTFVYILGKNSEQIDRYIQLVEEHGGEVLPVQLKPSLETLQQRVVRADRQHTTKLTNPEMLQKFSQQGTLYSTIPGGLHPIIDNSTLTPEETAATIIRHYGLSPMNGENQ